MNGLLLSEETLNELTAILKPKGIELVKDPSFTEFYLFEKRLLGFDSIAALYVESKSNIAGQYNGLCQGFLFEQSNSEVRNENNSGFIEANANGLAYVIAEVIYYNENQPTDLLIRVTIG